MCDFCDTQLSNYKLEQHQQTILKAQQEQMQMYIAQLTLLDEQKDIEQKTNDENKAKFKDFLTKELEKKNQLEQDVQKMEQRTQELFDHRNKLSN